MAAKKKSCKYKEEIMSDGKCVLPVIFRKDKKDGEVIALFPSIFSSGYSNIQSYQHVGQHSSADYNTVIDRTKSATPKEYKSLKSELHKIGYRKLKIYKKETEAMRRAKNKQRRM